MPHLRITLNKPASNNHRWSALLLLAWLGGAVMPASACQVLKPEGALRYEGDCEANLAHGQGKAWIPTRTDKNSYYIGRFNRGFLHGEVDYVYANGKMSIKDYFFNGRNVSRHEYEPLAAEAEAEAAPAWKRARQTNTTAAYTQFIKDYQKAPQTKEAQDIVWQIEFDQAKRTNTIAAYTQFIKDFPNAPQAKEVQDIVWKTAFDQAKLTNTIAAYTQFIKDFPNALQAKEAQDIVWQTAFDQAKRTNSTSAYTQFIKDFSNAPQAKEAQDIIWRTAFEQAKRTNTTSAYTQFIKNYPNASQVSDAKDHVFKLLEPPIRNAESAYKCEDAKRLNDQFASAEMPSIFDFDRCVAERKFHNVLTGANPQSMYLAGVKYENDGERGKAKKVYLTIMDKFSEHAMALKAADRLAGMNDVAAVEDAQWRTRQAIESSNEEVRRASQDAANRQDRSRREFCSGKYSCESSCNSLRGNSYLHCNSACKATYSGC